MNDLLNFVFLILLLVVFGSLFVLPIVAIVVTLRSKKKLSQRLAQLESNQHLDDSQALHPQSSLRQELQQLKTRIQQLEALPSTRPIDVAEVTEAPVPVEPEAPPSLLQPPTSEPGPQVHAEQKAGARSAIDIESMIGRRWIGWAAVSLILFATAFFLKYAFDNRWIGEVGRVAIGIATGTLFTSLGFRYCKRGWRIFSQILTGGGIVLLYLSSYAAFGYYHLIPQKAAFVFLALLVVEAATLAILYEAPAIAIMALLGGFLTPLLLHSDRDQYHSFFGYLIAIDVGALAVLKHWRGLRTLAFVGSHLLFWIWYDQNYHEQKFFAVLVFQTTLFLLFLAARLVSQLLRGITSDKVEGVWLLLVNPFVFFATAYHLLNPYYHDWMGVFAISMALIYAGSAKLLLDKTNASSVELFVLIGISLTFVSIAIPIQLRSNWITIGWSIEALILLWAGIQTGTFRLRLSAFTLFGLAILRLLFWDTPYGNRGLFTPIFNRYFLSSILVIGCLFGAAALYQSAEKKISAARGIKLGFVLAGLISFWVVSSIEVHTFFIGRSLAQRVAEDARHQLWLGQMALSVVWAFYAAALAAIGFWRRSSSIRWVALSLFALTIIKAMLVDIARLQQLYRIIVFFVLGILLLLVAWAYHKAFYSAESST